MCRCRCRQSTVSFSCVLTPNIAALLHPITHILFLVFFEKMNWLSEVWTWITWHSKKQVRNIQQLHLILSCFVRREVWEHKRVQWKMDHLCQCFQNHIGRISLGFFNIGNLFGRNMGFISQLFLRQIFFFSCCAECLPQSSQIVNRRYRSPQ